MISIILDSEQIEDLLRCISHQMYHLERLYTNVSDITESHEYSNLSSMYKLLDNKLFTYLTGEEV